ncbi:MAG: DUF4214 domain-containing protein [Burkholderiaceae bacterium]|nr:MAG: DUF4214 domain-containing protein [Burkholderiaceae bacterium]
MNLLSPKLVMKWSVSFLCAALICACGGNQQQSVESSIPQFASAPPSAAPNASETQIVKGPRNNYTFTRISVGFVLTDRLGDQGSITITGKKAIQFDDVRVNLQMREYASMVSDQTLSSIIDLYLVFLGRVPDADGLSYWIDQYNNGLSLDRMANSFYQAALQYSSLTGYSSNMSEHDYVRQVYRLGLGRKEATAPGAAELDYWVTQLEAGQSRGAVARAIMSSARQFRDDAKWGWIVRSLDRRQKVARLFAVDQGLNYLSEAETIAKTMRIASLITPGSSFLAEQSIPTTDVLFSLNAQPYYGYLAQACTPAAKQSWVRAHLDDVYLWYKEIVDFPVTTAKTSEEYFDALLVKSKDRFSFTATQASVDGYFQTGTSVTYGYTLLRQGTRLRVLYVQPGSPADLAGLRRGATIAQVDGTSLAQPANDVQYAALYPSKSETHRFDIVDPGKTEMRSVNMTAISMSSKPVLSNQVLNVDGRKYGYMVFNDHIQSAEQMLIDGVNQFKAAGVQDLILDLRYNGGGYLYIADEIASMIGGSRTAGQIFEQLQYNDKHFANTYAGTTWFYAYDTKRRPLPQLNLSRVFILTGARTCSASESIINSLSPFVEVVLIGENTCGKPYGFRQTNNCGMAYFAIQFSGVNALGKGDYVSGFAPQCKVADDLDHALGDTAEARLAAALSYAKTGACPAVTTTPGGPPALGGERDPYPWRSIRLLP